ncbi:unnamed protein product [Cuscuta campestris]|uniref:Uncharacterized protein n=1 Tax=Cuscuta campestris TaxID=132261 RepID=A0A484MW20_9ASTE|nr:unnamed protein product [Cuscuta campestris]
MSQSQPQLYPEVRGGDGGGIFVIPTPNFPFIPPPPDHFTWSYYSNRPMAISFCIVGAILFSGILASLASRLFGRADDKKGGKKKGSKKNKGKGKDKFPGEWSGKSKGDIEMGFGGKKKHGKESSSSNSKKSSSSKNHKKLPSGGDVEISFV